MNESQPPTGARIGRQIVLPWRKAIQIAIKSIRVRFWRSMITMSSIILAIAFLMAIWTSTAIIASLAVRPQREIEGVRERLGIVRVAIKTQEIGLARSALQEATDPAAAKQLKEKLSILLAQREKLLDDIVAPWTERIDAAEREAKAIEKEQAELERGKELQRLRDHLAGERKQRRDAVAALSAEDIEGRYATDLAAAKDRAEDAIEDNEEKIESATSDERKKLEDEIKSLRASLAPAKSLELIRDYLANRKRELEGVKGAVDAILQQERVGSEKEGKAGEAGVALAAAGGFATDFLRHMSATDKWLAILALLVCFVGIVNAMFMTVQERFREIGTMKCLGALDAFIVKIFLIESATLGFIGTLFGIVVGLLLSTIRQAVVYGKPTFVYFPPGSILVAALMAAIAGLVLSIVAAIFPARRAARMEPVEAMRIEE